MSSLKRQKRYHRKVRFVYQGFGRLLLENHEESFENQQIRILQTFEEYNNNDIITRIPPSIDYSHVGKLKYLDRNAKLQSDDDLSWWDLFWDRVRGRLAGFFNKTIFDGIDDHSIEEYVSGIIKNL